MGRLLPSRVKGAKPIGRLIWYHVLHKMNRFSVIYISNLSNLCIVGFCANFTYIYIYTALTTPVINYKTF